MNNKTPNHFNGPASCPLSLEDVDLFGPGSQEHWYEAYAILHDQSPVLPLPGQGLEASSDAFVLTRHEDIEQVVKDPERFTPIMSLSVEQMQALHDRGEPRPQDSARFDIALESARTLRPTIKLWRAHRKELTDPWVGPGSKRHSALITRVVDELIDDWIDRDDGDGKGTVEFIQEFAKPLPQIIMATVLGFPLDDLPQLEAWGSALVIGFVEGKGHLNILDEKDAARQTERVAGFGEYIMQAITNKRANPADDMISDLINIRYQALDRHLTDDEIAGIVYMMILGGLETTQYALEEGAQLLCEDPALFETLRAQPDRIRAFTEECLRLRAPTQGLSTRMTTRDEIFQGVEVPAGSVLHIRFGAGNVDPKQYSCPYEIDLERKALGNHLSFSQGPRTCPGAGISRLEQVIAWDRLLARLAGMEYAPGNSFEHQSGIMLGTLALSLRFSKA